MAPLFSVASRPIGGGAGAGTGTGGGSATTTTTTTYGGNRLKQVQAREQQPSSSSSLSSGSSAGYYDSERVPTRPAAPTGAGAVRKGLPMLGGARKSFAAPTAAAARQHSSASASSASSSRLALPIYSRRPSTEEDELESDDEEEEADAGLATVRRPPPSASTLHPASSSSGSRLPALSRPEHCSPGKKLGTSSSASGRIVVSASPARPSASNVKSSGTSSANTGTGRTQQQQHHPLSTSSLRPPHLSTTLPPAQASGRRTFGEKDPNVLGSSSSPSLPSQASSSSSYSSGRISLAPSGGTAELQKPGSGVSCDAPPKPSSGTTLFSHRRQESIGKENRDPSTQPAATTTTTASGLTQGSAPRPAYNRESSYGTSTTRPSLSNASTSISSGASSTSTITPSSTLARPPLLSRSSGSSSSSASSALSALPSSSSSAATAAAAAPAPGGGGPKRQLLGSRAAYRSSSGHSSVAIKLGLAPATSSAAPSATVATSATATAAPPAADPGSSSSSSSVTPAAVSSRTNTTLSAKDASAAVVSASKLDSASSTSTLTAEQARTSASLLGTSSGRTSSSAPSQVQSKTSSVTAATGSSLSSSSSSSTSGLGSSSGSGRVSLTTAGGSRDSIQPASGNEGRPSQHQQQSTERKEHSRLSILRETAHEASPSSLAQSPLLHRVVHASAAAARANPRADADAEAECWTPTRDRTRRPRPQRRTAAASGAINYCEDSPTLDERIYARAHVGEKKHAAVTAQRQLIPGPEKSQQRPREERGAERPQPRTAQSQSTFAHTPPRPDRPRPSARPSSVREIDFDLLDRERERVHQHSVGAAKEEEEDESQESIILLSHTIRRSSIAAPAAKASAPALSVARARTEATKAESAKAPARKKTAEELEEDELAELVEEQLHALTIGKSEKAASAVRPVPAPALRPVQPTTTKPALSSSRPVSKAVAAPKPKEPLAALLAACGQSKTLDFEACLSALLTRSGSRRSIIKIGEASYSEVYRIQPAPISASSKSAAPDEPSIVLKVIPLRPKSPVIDAETGEEQNSLGENLPATSSCTNALRELRVTRSLGGSPEELQLILPGQHAPFSAPSSASSSSIEPEQGLPGFVRLYGAFVARGLYASALMRCWDEFDAAVKDGSENRSPGESSAPALLSSINRLCCRC